MLNVLGTFSGWAAFEPSMAAIAAMEAGALNTTAGVSGVVPFDAAIATLVAVDADMLFVGMDQAGVTSAFTAWAALVLPLGFIFATSAGAVFGGSKAAAAALAGAGATSGTSAASVTAVVRLWVWLLDSSDVFLLFGELALVGAVLAGFAQVIARMGVRTHGYHDIITLCQQRGVSAGEVFSVVSFLIGFILFDAFVTMAEDDALEAISYVFAGIICLAVLLLSLAVDLQYYYLISSISGGEQTLRLLYTDIVNNVLCLLRIFFCWIRYLFYDLQAELVDFSFHYTELAEEGVLGSGLLLSTASVGGMTWGWGGWAVFSGTLLVVLLDGVSVLLQLLIGAFKLALALFLFWLILDLFLLRTLARTEARWEAIRAWRRG